jgi:hypothetical protein
MEPARGECPMGMIHATASIASGILRAPRASSSTLPGLPDAPGPSQIWPSLIAPPNTLFRFPSLRLHLSPTVSAIHAWLTTMRIGWQEGDARARRYGRHMGAVVPASYSSVFRHNLSCTSCLLLLNLPWIMFEIRRQK